jgi:hypothetical protein
MACGSLLAPLPAVAGARPPEAAAGRGGLDTRSMSDDQLRRRMLDACVTLMTQKPEPLKSAAVPRCTCYSNAVMKNMGQDERDALRATGGFSPSARPKAQAALQTCRVAG